MDNNYRSLFSKCALTFDRSDDIDRTNNKQKRRKETNKEIEGQEK